VFFVARGSLRKCLIRLKKRSTRLRAKITIVVQISWSQQEDLISRASSKSAPSLFADYLTIRCARVFARCGLAPGVPAPAGSVLRRLRKIRIILVAFRVEATFNPHLVHVEESRDLGDVDVVVVRGHVRSKTPLFTPTQQKSHRPSKKQ